MNFTVLSIMCIFAVHAAPSKRTKTPLFRAKRDLIGYNRGQNNVFAYLKFTDSEKPPQWNQLTQLMSFYAKNGSKNEKNILRKLMTPTRSQRLKQRFSSFHQK